MKPKLKKNILFSSIYVTLFMLIIKAFGLVKQIIIAKICGADYSTDAFYISTGIIEHISVAIFSGLSITLLSLYSETIETSGSTKSNKLINAAIHTFIPLAFIFSILFYTLSPMIAKVLVPTYQGENLIRLVKYFKIMSLSFVPTCYYLILNVILEEKKFFIPGRCKGLFQNILIILSALICYKKIGIDALVYAYLISSVVQCILITVCINNEFKLSFAKTNCYKKIKKVICLSLPLIIGNAVYEINDIVDKQISANLGGGTTSLLTYGATLNEIITGIIISSISIVLFSNFATWVAKKQNDKVETNLSMILETLNMILIPTTAIFIFLGDDIVNIFYGNGNLSSKELNDIYFVIIGYSLGFVFQAMRSNLVKVLYAYQDTNKPMIVGCISIFLNIILSFILSRYIGVSGIAFATSFSMFISTILLFKFVKKYLLNLNFKNILFENFKYIIGGVIVSLILIIIDKVFKYNPFISILIKGGIGFIVYFLILLIIKSNRFLEILNFIKNNLKLKKIERLFKF